MKFATDLRCFLLVSQVTWQILVTVSIVTGQVYLHVRIMGYKRCYVITDYGVNNMTNKIAYQSSQSATEEDIASLIIAIVLVAIFYIVRCIFMALFDLKHEMKD